MTNLKRARELLDAWEKGAVREDDLAELRGILPAIFEAARRPNGDEIAAEAKAAMRGLEEAPDVWIGGFRLGYHSGALRIGREP